MSKVRIEQLPFGLKKIFVNDAQITKVRNISISRPLNELVTATITFDVEELIEVPYVDPNSEFVMTNPHSTLTRECFNRHGWTDEDLLRIGIMRRREKFDD